MPGVATEPWPACMVTPPPYDVTTSRTPWPNRSAGSPRPGISTFPSTTSGSPPAGQTETKQPPPRLTIPGSVARATKPAASAASTALPPSAATASPASSACRPVAATATRRVGTAPEGTI